MASVIGIFGMLETQLNRYAGGKAAASRMVTTALNATKCVVETMAKSVPDVLVPAAVVATVCVGIAVVRQHCQETPAEDSSLEPQEADTPEKDTSPSISSTAQRAMSIALPFLSLYEPISCIVSASTGITHMADTHRNWEEKGTAKTMLEFGLTILSVASVAGSALGFRLGPIVVTTVGLIQTLSTLISDIKAGNEDAYTEDVLQLGQSVLNLKMVLNASPLTALTALLLQVVLCIDSASKEWSEDRSPEALAKLVMGSIRLYQSCQLFLPRENDKPAPESSPGEPLTDTVEDVAENPLSEPLKDSAEEQPVEFASDTPLNQLLVELAQLDRLISTDWYTTHWCNQLDPLDEDVFEPASSLPQDLEEQIKQKQVIATDANGNPYNFGAHFHGYGKILVKGANLCFRTKIVDGKEMIELDFKLNHYWSREMHGLAESITSSQEEVSQIVSLSSSAQGLEVRKEEIEHLEHTTATEFTFKGLGSISIINQEVTKENCISLLDRVIVRFKKGKSTQEIHELLSFLGLHRAIQQSSEEDMEKLKVGHLFRQLAPQQAIRIERSTEFIALPIDELKLRMLSLIDNRDLRNKVERAFQEDLPKMKSVEILPNRIRYSIPGVAGKCHNLGARGLIATITGTSNQSTNEVLNRTVTVLKMGLIASEVRSRAGIQVAGLASSIDFMAGSADSVFTQLITQNTCQKQISTAAVYNGPIRLIISLDILETGTYQYHRITSGSRYYNYKIESEYSNRNNIFQFVNQEQKDFGRRNEVMIKERVPPNQIKGIIVETPKLKDQLTTRLREQGMIQKNEQGQETISNIALDKFIHVASRFSEELFAEAAPK